MQDSGNSIWPLANLCDIKSFKMIWSPTPPDLEHVFDLLGESSLDYRAYSGKRQMSPYFSFVWPAL